VCPDEREEIACFRLDGFAVGKSEHGAAGSGGNGNGWDEGGVGHAHIVARKRPPRGVVELQLLATMRSLLGTSWQL